MMRFSADTYYYYYIIALTTTILQAVLTKTVVTAGTLDDVYSVMVSNPNQCVQKRNIIYIIGFEKTMVELMDQSTVFAIAFSMA